MSRDNLLEPVHPGMRVLWWVLWMCASVACSPLPAADDGGGGGSTAGGSTAGGSAAGGTTAGGSAAGGSTAGGSTAGGSAAGGSAAGGAGGGAPHDGGWSLSDAGNVSADGGPFTDGGPSTGRIPLSDLGTRGYLGFQGGLYPGGSNDVPAGHLAVGIARAMQVAPLDADGGASASGKVVLLSIGMSNCSQEFCSGAFTTNCDVGSFMGRAANDPAVEKTRLVIVNGAIGGRVAGAWVSPSSPDYDTVRDQRLQVLGVTERQVQVVWLKAPSAGPYALPDTRSTAHRFKADLGSISRALKVRYPNLKLLFVSSRIYGGYATVPLNPEPFAYEHAFGVKWGIEAQLRQMAGLGIDPATGDLDYNGVAPWMTWGPYLWADGLSPRSDGLTWAVTDFQSDGTHPSASGVSKVGAQLLDFFKTSPVTRCWFVAGGTCP